MADQAKVPTLATVSAVITRADGTRIDVGTISATYRNPIQQLWWRTVGRRRAHQRIAAANRQLGA